MKPRVIIPWFPGTNCHWETKHAFEKAGADGRIVLLKQLLDGRVRLTDADLIALAGGFSWGDHLRAGYVAAMDFVYLLRDQLLEAVERQIPMIGICNGFQMLVTAGLLPGGQGIGKPTALLDNNASARFEHWNRTVIYLHKPSGIDCLWVKGLDGHKMYLPVGHGEGQLVLLDGSAVLNVVATYGTMSGDASYPVSPNGSAVAGICDPTGRIIGLMPHPERRTDSEHGGAYGLPIFQAGVNAVK